MGSGKPPYQAAFWESDDTHLRPSKIEEYGSRQHAEDDIARELGRANYRKAVLYNSSAVSAWQDPVQTFTSDDFPMEQ